ncbi:Bug family tripartite tricarboxylate transporter substrate binding protein [Limimaricola litoreus]|uniref:Tripartite tricarboxylate transporter substrate binding protein n=1 Tax=Limimaricola litoreus TaxID=2955316 RepID=A0A9X2FXP5_9RHOB|nr:tripartite tricarboxylate transporter substrate binding protein [Limimaricola litoreus]MCP1170346.1 tripartite tricarboxylate transporter substrate binding protein [Limimaricola litoreus]
MKRLLTGIAVVTGLGAGAVHAQDYPSKAITLVAPYGAGGASDLAARALAESAKQYIGEPITVENRTGAGGMVGARSVADAEADGYTVLLARVGMILNPAVNPQTMVKADEYTYLGALESTPMILSVDGESEIESVEQLVEAIKESNGRMTYAASGATSIDGFTTQALLKDAGLDPLTAATLVPYKGGNALATAVMGGHVDFGAWAAGSQMGPIEAGDLKPLAVFAPERMDQLPDVPTMSELGYETAGQITGWSALFGPEDLSEEVVAKWDEVLDKVAEDSTWLDLAEKRGSISTVGTVDVTEYAKSQFELFNGLAKDFGYLPE